MPLNGRCVNKIFQIGPVKYVQDSIINLKARNTSCDAFSVMLSIPKKVIEGRFEQLELGGCPVQLIPYPTVAKVSEI